jgi:uncharacterized protein YjbJ (UPF0337 family)
MSDEQNIGDRAKTAGKNIEGKVQENLGKITGDPEAQAEGKEKQVENSVRQQAKEVKDNIQEKLE